MSFPYRGGAALDASIASVVLLLGFEGADGSTTFTDESTATNKGNGTAVGNAQIDTAQFKFGASSGLFDGTGDYWTWADHADWHLSNANSDQFTVEFWMRAPNTGVNRYPMSHGTGSGNMSWYVNTNYNATPSSSSVQFVFSLDGALGGSLVTLTANCTLNIDTWHYVAVGKNSSGKIRVHVDGAFINSSTPANSAFFNPSTTMNIGRGISANWNGWLDEIRITKGVCRYDTDSAIAVPTAAFPRS